MSNSFVLWAAPLLGVSLLMGCSDARSGHKNPGSGAVLVQWDAGGVDAGPLASNAGVIDVGVDENDSRGGATGMPPQAASCDAGDATPPTPEPGVGPDPAEGAPVDNCPLSLALTEACTCGGSSYSEGFCCESGFSYSACEERALYVTAQGAGNKSGSDWANAFAGLPADLQRGTLYWLAAGSYGSRKFDDSASGEAGITLRKATATHHGSDLGWQQDLGVGPAVFGPVHFSQPRYTLDGGEPNGIKMVGVMGTEAVCNVEGSHVVLRRVEMNGGVEKSGNTQIAGACMGGDIAANHVVLDRSEVHNIADDGLGIFAENIRILNSKVHDLHGCGTDSSCKGPCYNGHSDGLEMYGAAHIELSGNLIYDVRSTAALFMYGSGNEIADLVAHNNVFYAPLSGISVYLQDLNGAEFYNNVIWGRSNGDRYGGLAIGKNVRGLSMANNIILNINYSHLASRHDPVNHQLDYNLFGVVNPGEYTLMPNDVVADPQFSGIPMSSDTSAHKGSDLDVNDFLPMAAAAIDNGKDIKDKLGHDIQGTPRPRGEGFDRGVFEISPQK